VDTNMPGVIIVMIITPNSMSTGIIQHRPQEIGATRFILWPTLQRLLPTESDFRYSLGWPEVLIATM
jgi:hypothetical protein